MNKLLWVLQILLAIGFLMAGGMKLMMPIADIVAIGSNMVWAGDVPAALVRFIGLAEILGAIGLILPAATRIQPQLTAFAAAGLAVVTGLAMIFHITRGEFAVMIPSVMMFVLVAFVAYGRFKLAPIAPKGQENDPAPA